MDNCVFCKIINNELPKTVIYEDDIVLAIVPKKKVSQGHTLLIPKVHSENILDVDKEIFAHFSKILNELSIKLVKDNKATGINILNANGKDAQQSVMHLHFHLVPRYPDDGLDMWIKQGL
jgi:histidine triad (HIT) family protein